MKFRLIEEQINEELLIEMADVIGRKVKVENINFSFYFSKQQDQHTIRAKIFWNREKLGPSFDGTMLLFGDYKYIESTSPINKHSKTDEDRARVFFKKYKVLFAACWEDKLEPADVVDFLQGGCSFKELISEFYGINHYDEIQKVSNINELYSIVKKYNIFNLYDGQLNEEQIDYNANPQGKNEGDCTIRALSLAYDLRYNNVKSELNSIARQNNSEFNELNTIKAFIDKHGSQNYINNETSGSAIDDVDDFARKNRNGIFVIYCTNKTKQDTSNSFHLVTIINGKIYDTWDPSKYYVIGAWKIKSGNYNRTVNSISQQEGE